MFRRNLSSSVGELPWRIRQDRLEAKLSQGFAQIGFGTGHWQLNSGSSDDNASDIKEIHKPLTILYRS
jgi:hypothetical protein